MKGKHRIIIQNKKIRYDFEIRRNITVIRGDSATGKTTLVEMVHEYYENGVNSGIELQCEKTCLVIEGRNWELILSSIKNSIVFIDEGNSFVGSKEFAKVIQESDNYYVIVTREALPTLPYSVNESSYFFSWERFFTHLLVEKTADSYLTYSKKELNDAYRQDMVLNRILDSMEKIKFL